jgi:hypothetical protein
MLTLRTEISTGLHPLPSSRSRLVQLLTYLMRIEIVHGYILVGNVDDTTTAERRTHYAAGRTEDITRDV